MVNSSELINEFLIESFENLSNISDDITRYEQVPSDSDLLNSIYRKVHTVKGSASFLGFKKLQSITHAAENVLDKLRSYELKISPVIIDVLLLSFDNCLEVLREIESAGEEGGGVYEEVISKLRLIEEGKSSSIEKSGERNVKIQNVNERILGEGYKIVLDDQSSLKKAKNAKGTALASKQELNIKIDPKNVEMVKGVGASGASGASVKNEEIVKTNLKDSKHGVKSMEEREAKEPSDESDKGSSKNIADSVVRVNVHLLDKIMNVVGELVLSRNQILQYASKENSPELSRLAQQINVITSDLQNDIMTTRMQPVGTVLGKFERIVRDLSRTQKKKIKLTVIGKDTELDKSLLEAIRDPMTHMIRNSVDHGIEEPDIRLSNGKPEEGNITIRAYHEGGHVIIEITDDGKGINPVVISEKAVQKGLITQEQADRMSEAQILNIIFAPGFSTAEKVTNISGRGVGMDVVKSNVDRIGGTVDLSSVVGEGSRFKMKIPLTLAIVPALIVESHKEVFAIPQINLTELVQLDNDGTSTDRGIEVLHGAEFFRLREELIPIVRLNKLLGLSSSSEIAQEALKPTNVVVVNVDGKSYGLVVDTILDTEEIVVKPLSQKIKSLSKFAGATIMGDGRVALILDIAGIYTEVRHDVTSDNEQQMMADSRNFEGDVDTHEMVMVKLGDERIYGIPLCLVKRLEEFPRDKVEWSADQALVQYAGESLPLINVEKMSGLNGKSTLDIFDKSDLKFVPCVVVSIKNHGFGFVVSEIKDIATTTNTISSETVDRDGLLGTLVVGEKTITVLDIHGVVDKHGVGSKVLKNISVKHKANILLVEDSPLYRKVTEEFLTDNGFAVTTVVNGKEALDLLLGNAIKIDLVISDIEMPIMDGYQMVHKIRQVDKYKKLPVVAVSTRVNDKSKAKGEEAGFTSQLEKLNREEVLGSINNLLGFDK